MLVFGLTSCVGLFQIAAAAVEISSEIKANSDEKKLLKELKDDEPITAGENETLISILRKTGSLRRGTQMTILVDGIEVTKIANNSTREIVVLNGDHTIVAHWGKNGFNSKIPHPFTADSRPINFSIRVVNTLITSDILFDEQ
ncbi:hypothetical protein FACS189494_08470 [Spirochaetia bacterium]|nr:hypothetical protein FACS189494_08470 [Spirochaetia bacterium]